MVGFFRYTPEADNQLGNAFGPQETFQLLLIGEWEPRHVRCHARGGTYVQDEEDCSTLRIGPH
jgi:hypothetical protein